MGRASQAFFGYACIADWPLIVIHVHIVCTPICYATKHDHSGFWYPADDIAFRNLRLCPHIWYWPFPVVKMEKAQPPAEGANKNVSAATIRLQAPNKAD
jgi:hypothetical protein